MGLPQSTCIQSQVCSIVQNALQFNVATYKSYNHQDTLEPFQKLTAVYNILNKQN